MSVRHMDDKRYQDSSCYCPQLLLFVMFNCSLSCEGGERHFAPAREGDDMYEVCSIHYWFLLCSWEIIIVTVESNF